MENFREAVENILLSASLGESEKEPIRELLKAYEKQSVRFDRIVKQSDKMSAEIAQKNDKLEDLSKKLSKYLSPQIYDLIFSGKQDVMIESARKKLTIFFSDIVGFTSTTEKLESEELTILLNDYLTKMTDIALKYGATVDKYIGDAIVIFFGDPQTKGYKEDALLCLKMAIEMQEAMKDLRAKYVDEGIVENFQIRMGINTGYCTVGNFGSAERMDYTIIGGNVNLASRLESNAAADQILISHETYSLVKEYIEVIKKEKITVKGISEPIQTYQVEGLKTEQNEVYSKHILGLSVQIDKLKIANKQEALRLLNGAIEKLVDE